MSDIERIVAGLPAQAKMEAAKIGAWQGLSPLPQWLNNLSSRGYMRLVPIDLGNNLTTPRRWKAYPTTIGLAPPRSPRKAST